MPRSRKKPAGKLRNECALWCIAMHGAQVERAPSLLREPLVAVMESS